MEYGSPEKVLREFGRLWPALAGITYSRIHSRGIQWPCPSEDHPGTVYLYKDGFPKGKVRFMPVSYKPPAEVADKDYPFVLTTGRNLFQYHSGSMTRRVKPLEIHAGEPYVEINPSDAARLKINDRDVLQIFSRRGVIEIRARITQRVTKGTVFIPMHYREAAANVITNDALDPTVKIPELKVCAVKVVASHSKRASNGKKRSAKK
jgi:predicted molibdopterin-dependent oxidoreductase YjgC